VSGSVESPISVNVIFGNLLMQGVFFGCLLAAFFLYLANFYCLGH